MNPLNMVCIEGNLTKDTELKQTPKGKSVCNFTIATDHIFNYGFEKQKETTFVDVEAWGEIAETCGRIGKKGRGCRVTGRIKQQQWNKPDGSLRSKIIIVAEKIEYKPEKKEGTQ